jgi:hypothetical protein
MDAWAANYEEDSGVKVLFGFFAGCLRFYIGDRSRVHGIHNSCLTKTMSKNGSKH